MSVSDDVSEELGGGTLQLWRVNDLIYRPEADVLAELDKHRSAAAAMCCLQLMWHAVSRFRQMSCLPVLSRGLSFMVCLQCAACIPMYCSM